MGKVKDTLLDLERSCEYCEEHLITYDNPIDICEDCKNKQETKGKHVQGTDKLTAQALSCFSKLTF